MSSAEHCAKTGNADITNRTIPDGLLRRSAVMDAGDDASDEPLDVAVAAFRIGSVQLGDETGAGLVQVDEVRA